MSAPDVPLHKLPLSDMRVLQGIRDDEFVDAVNGTTAPPTRTGFIDGGTFILDAPASVRAIWGEGTAVLWPEGEPTMLYGPDGVGKTTVVQQLVLARIGVGGPRELFHHPVAPTGSKVLYLALDRPKQAQRSWHRMVTEIDRDALEAHLDVWRGSLPIDIVRDPASLHRFAKDRGADTIVIDSLKDIAPKLSDEDTGMAIHKAWQLCVEHGVEVLSLHHPRKAQADNKKPRQLSDVYGSRWITAGCGSVLLLWGDAGDPVVELEHLKQPADVVGPLTLLHNNESGETTVIGASDVVDIVKKQPDSAATVAEVATALFHKTDRTEIEKARRKLDAAVRDGKLKRPFVPEGQPVKYYVIDPQGTLA